MIGWLQRHARSHRYFQICCWALFALFVLYVLNRLSGVLAPFFVAAAIAYWLDPAVDWMERKGMKRTPAILLLLLGFLVFLTGILLIIVPLLVREFNMMGDKLPGYVQKAHHSLLPWIEKTFHTTVPRTLGELIDRAGADAQSLAKSAMSSLQTVVGGTFKSVFSLLRIVLNLVLVPVFAFYLLRDFDTIVDKIRLLVPERRRTFVVDVAREIDRVLSAWFRGQLTVIIIDGALYMIGLSVLGVPMGVAIGAIAGLLAFIPVVGVLTSLTLALLVTCLEFQGWGQVIGVVALFAAVPTIEMTVVVPRVIGGRVGLGPVAVIVALLLGAELLGFIGILLAVPTAAVVNVLLGRIRSAYEGSAFFTRSAQPEGEAPASPPPPGAPPPAAPPSPPPAAPPSPPPGGRSD
jgi:predicted PurR-regulated permease PerM